MEAIGAVPTRARANRWLRRDVRWVSGRGSAKPDIRSDGHTYRRRFGTEASRSYPGRSLGLQEGPRIESALRTTLNGHAVGNGGDSQGCGLRRGVVGAGR